jgi:hypothetical protein
MARGRAAVAWLADAGEPVGLQREGGTVTIATAIHVAGRKPFRAPGGTQPLRIRDAVRTDESIRAVACGITRTR